MPNLVKFREDPDAMLVMSLEDYDEVTGKADQGRDHDEGRGRQAARPSRHVRSAEEGLLVSLDQRGAVDLPFIATLYGKPEDAGHRRTGRPDLPRPGVADLADGRRLSLGQRPGEARRAERAGPAYARNAEALRAVQPEDVLPGDIDANLGAPWIPESDIQAFAAELFGVAAVVDPDRPPEEGRGLERRRRLRRRAVGRRHLRVRHARGPTAPGSWNWR